MLSAIVAYELHYKIQKQRIGKAKTDTLAALMLDYKFIPFNNKSAEVASKVRVHLESDGKMIGYWDTLHAGHAKSINLICITDNVGEYERVPGLKIEIWLRPEKSLV